MTYVIIIGVFQALFGISLVFFSGKKRPLHSLIIGFLSLVFAHLFIKFVIYTVLGNYTLQKGFNTFIDLAYGPMLWIIAKKLQDDSLKPLKYWYVFIPSFVAAIAYFTIVITIITTKSNPVKLINIYNYITLIILIISTFIFSVAAYRITRRLNVFWKAEKIMIRNISIALVLIVIICYSYLMCSYLVKISNKSFLLGCRITIYSILVFVCIEILRYLILAKADELKSGTLKDEEKIQTEEIKKSSLSKDQQQSLVAELDKVMTGMKLYKDPDLNLEKLSAITNISRHHISEALNQYSEKTFYQFLNEYRLNEVLMMLNKYKQDNIRPNILSLAFAVGFNSKSSFNQYFKKYTSFTPTEYLKSEGFSSLKNEGTSTELLLSKAGDNDLKIY